MQYRLKQRVQAMQFTGFNRRDLLAFAYPNLSKDALEAAEAMRLPVVISTKDGDVTVPIGFWVVRSADNELTTCRADDFEATYEPA